MPASRSGLDALYQKHAMSSPEALLEDALAHESWSAALGLAQQWPDRLSPSFMLEALTRHITFFKRLRPSENLLFEPATNTYGRPPMLDAWLFALIQAGADPGASMKGRWEKSESWEGTVHALAVLGDAMQTLTHLATLSPVASWANTPVVWQGQPSTLLHLACATERWPVARFLIEHGFPTHAPDGSGAQAWERVDPQARVASNEFVFDQLGLWPQTSEDLAAGWSRLSLSSSKSDAAINTLWRTKMARRSARGEEFERQVAIERILQLGTQSASVFPDELTDLVHLWRSTSPEDRERPMAIHAGPMRGQWSMAGAMAWMGAWLNEKLVPALKDEKATSGYDVFANLNELDVFGQILPAISNQELDRPIAQRKLVTGDSIDLTARGMWGMGCLRVERALPRHEASFDYADSRPDPAWARSIVDSWAVLSLLPAGGHNPGASGALLGSHLTDLIFPAPDAAWTSWTPALRAGVDSKHLIKVLTTVDRAATEANIHFYTLTLAVPSDPFSPKELTQLPSPWDGLAKAKVQAGAPTAKRWRETLKGVGLTRVAKRLNQWGWPLDMNQVHLVVKHLDNVNPGWGSEFLAHVRETEAQKVPVREARRSRVRS